MSFTVQCLRSKSIRSTIVRGLPNVIDFILSFHDLGFSKHTGYRCFSALVNLSRNRESASQIRNCLKVITIQFE